MECKIWLMIDDFALILTHIMPVFCKDKVFAFDHRSTSKHSDHGNILWKSLDIRWVTTCSLYPHLPSFWIQAIDHTVLVSVQNASRSWGSVDTQPLRQSLAQDWCSTWDGNKYDLVFYGVSGYTGYLMMERFLKLQQVMGRWNSPTMTSDTVPVANHVGQYDTEVFVFPEVLNFHSPKKKRKNMCFTRIWPPWVLTPYVPKFQEYLKRVSLKRNPEPFTFCFAGRTPSRVAELRDREFAGTQWLGHVTLRCLRKILVTYIISQCYTETRNKKFHVMARFFLVKRVGW